MYTVVHIQNHRKIPLYFAAVCLLAHPRAPGCFLRDFTIFRAIFWTVGSNGFAGGATRIVCIDFASRIFAILSTQGEMFGGA